MGSRRKQRERVILEFTFVPLVGCERVLTAQGPLGIWEPRDTTRHTMQQPSHKRLTGKKNRMVTASGQEQTQCRAGQRGGTFIGLLEHAQ